MAWYRKWYQQPDVRGGVVKVSRDDFNRFRRKRFLLGGRKGAGGHRLSFIDANAKSDKVLVMLHGNPTWSFFYRNLIAAFRGEYRCIVPDHIGCGLSDKPQHYSYTLSQHIDNLEALLEHLEVERFTLIVHDWGGAIGSGFAVRHPERIERMVIMNTAAFHMNRIPFSISLCRVPVAGEWIVRKFNAFAKPATIMATAKGLSKEEKESYLEPYNSWNNRIAVARFVQDIPLETEHPTYPVIKGIEAQLPLLKDVPKLLCWGMKDFCFTPRFLHRWQEIFPDSRTCEFPEAGHYLPEDEPEALEQAITAFLKEAGKTGTNG